MLLKCRYASPALARYRVLVGPFSALIRLLVLRIVKSDAERRSSLMTKTDPTTRESLARQRHRETVIPVGDRITIHV